MSKTASVLPKPKPRTKPRTKPESRRSLPVAPPPRTAAQGLCTTCLHAGSCTFSRDPAIRIAECQEFDGGTGKAVEPVPQGGRTPSSSTRNPATGLCATCEAFATCTLPRHVAGVWRCEEFR